MITTFSGEFLVHPIPFEMSMDLCSHRCVYCFASVKRKINKFELKAFINQMQALQKGKKGWLYDKLREGYPVCLSNNTDPFADNNALYTESVLEYFKMLGVKEI